MPYLIDTHVLIWSIIDQKAFSKKVLSILQDPGNVIYVSALSFWEISLKFGLEKLAIKGFRPENLPVLCKEIGFQVLSLSPDLCATYHQLSASYHRDPFDKMLIWQAIQGNYTLLSKDKKMEQYRPEGLRVLW
ncbi:type II toxin-antitoxin system VapC family toxin [Olivibacter ginsenosidimutans]|uniref:Type II toxin-antitoxin system VapC family toxin n=1 Tax=Olivibacter ginsenosidimutans TaxID=1176537 RepID=A0ABP9ATS6_9SPHI